MMCVDNLAPDISLAALHVNKIDPLDLQGLEIIGEGSFAQVFKGYYQAKTVAVKQLVFEEDFSSESLLSSTSSISSSSSSPPLASSFTSSIEEGLNASTSSQPTSISSQNHSIKLASQASLANMTEFRREVWLMSTLQHPNIVSMIGFCFEPYSIVMEYMDKGSLSSFLQKSEDLPYSTQLQLALDVAKGMMFLHSASPPIVHRDLKSPNVLMQSSPDAPYVTCKVSDFGLSRSLVSGFVSKVIDNPRWCAPEILQNKEYDEKADVYSFAIILWEICTRQFPFDEFNIKWVYVLEDKIITGLRPTIPATCPQRFSALISQCWDAQPTARPSFDEIVTVIEEMISTA